MTYFILLTDMQILRFSTAVPRSEFSTEELLEAFPCQIPEGVKQNILNLGVKHRYLVDYTDASLESETILSERDIVDLCLETSEKALESTGLSAENVGYLIVAYDVNPFLCPGLSQLLVRKLGFSPYIKHVNVQGMACTAFTKALELAKDHLAVHPKDFVLLCVSGVNSYWFYNQVLGIKDLMEIRRINSMGNENIRRLELRKWIATMEFFLFGDGVASVIVANEGNGLSVDKIVEVTNLRKKDYLAGYTRLTALNEPFKFGFYSHLDKEIPNLGVEYISVALEKLLGENVESFIKNAKKLAVHTGSQKILDLIAERYKVQPEKLVESFEVLREYGNLAGASLPFILEKMVSANEFSEGDAILALGYGWGFSASACSLEFKTIESQLRCQNYVFTSKTNIG
jgi:predicted naringenin-chalcone synthase